MRLTVPGNLLLAGEYLVLDEGGRGLAVAVEPRLSATATTSPGGTWSIRAVMGDTSLLWLPGNDTTLPLAGAMILSCAGVLESRGKPMPAPLDIEVDSSAFFNPGGRKAGFGSSAAAAVAIALLIGRAAGLHGKELIDYSAEAALAGHRAAQGGRGSGYDVYASLHGSTGIFSGGKKPYWTPLGSLPSFRGLLVPGPAAVKSAEAVSAYRLWLSDASSPSGLPGLRSEAQAIIDSMKASVSALANATVSGDISAFRAALDLAGIAGRQLGELIGYSAFIPPPPGFESTTVKALGAGNELGLMILDNPRPDSPATLSPGTLAFRPSGGPQWLS